MLFLHLENVQYCVGRHLGLLIYAALYNEFLTKSDSSCTHVQRCSVTCAERVFSVEDVSAHVKIALLKQMCCDAW